MNLRNEFHPHPKRPHKAKKKGLDTHKGKTIPSAKKRSSVTKKQYNLMIEHHGSVCLDCENPYVDVHHARFRSQQGKGGFRNLIPLCKIHHMKCHKIFSYAEQWREWLIERYGELYYCDKYDLWKMGLIKEPDYNEFEKYMQKRGKSNG